MSETTQGSVERFAPSLVALVRNISDLHEDPKNARLHDGANLDSIVASLHQFGQQKPIVISKDGKVLAGNGTLRAAKSLGWRRIAVSVSDLNDVSAKAYAIADNRTAELAAWDSEQLTATLKELIAEGGPVEATGFSAEDLAALTEEQDDLVAPVLEDFDVSPKAPPVWVVVETDAEGASKLDTYFQNALIQGRLERSDVDARIRTKEKAAAKAEALAAAREATHPKQK